MTGLPFYYGWVIVGAALATQFIAVGAQTGVIGAFTKPMTEGLDWSRSELFLAETIAHLVMAVVGVRLGPYVDRLGTRPVMLTGIAVLVPSLLLISQVTELWQWLILRGFVLAGGVALMGLFVASVAVSKWFVTLRGRALGLRLHGGLAGGRRLAAAGHVRDRRAGLARRPGPWSRGWRCWCSSRRRC